MAVFDFVREVIADFVSHIPEMARPSESIHPLADINEKARAWSHKWSASPGVYIFVDGDSVEYVGKAMASSSLAQCVNHDLQEGDDSWNAYLASGAASVVVYAAEPQDEVWIPSLEFWLIRKLQPRFNRLHG